MKKKMDGCQISRENFPLLPFKIQTCPRNAKKRPQPQQAVVPAMCPDKVNRSL